MTSKSASLPGKIHLPAQVKETGYATGERAQGIADTEIIIFDQHLHGFQGNVSKPATHRYGQFQLRHRRTAGYRCRRS
ncbi:hypothetical protein ACLB1O_20190 [Escherichia coli]